MQIRTARTPEAIEAIAGEWDALAQDAGTANPFYESWMTIPALALPEARGLELLLAYDGDRLAGLLPIQTRPIAGRFGPHLIRNWENRVRALGEPLVCTGCERRFWAAILEHLDARGGAYLRLSWLREDSASTLALHDELAARRRDAMITRRIERAVLRGGTSAAEYRAAHIRKKVLKEQKRLANRLADQAPLAIERLLQGADADPWIDDLFRLEATGWKGREGVAAAADPETARCFRAILQAAHARGRLDFLRLAHGDHPISMLATIEAPASQAFQLKIAYDEAYAAFSPGVLLEMAYLDAALDVRGLDHVDSCARAGHPMIDRIWVDRMAVVSLAVPLASVSSRAVVRGLRIARRLRRRSTGS